jgi:hypothetical protein
MMADRYELLTVRSYTDSQGEEKKAFTKIGTVWPMKDRDGFSISFDALPLPTLNKEGALETRALMLPPKPRDDDQQQRQPERQQQGSYGSVKDNSTRRPAAHAPAFESGGMDDDIPF